MFETIGSICSIILNLAGIMFCLFHYIKKPLKEWIYATFYLLCALLSNYYWGVYVLIMDDYPNVSSILAYFGWDLSYVLLVVLFFHLHKKEKHFFSLLALIPIPLNIYQLSLYLPYGGLFNNIEQVGSLTIVAVLSLNSIVYYHRNKQNGANKPYIAYTAFFYSVCEFSSWTASCFDWPSELLDPYNYASLLSSCCYVLIPIAIAVSYKKSEDNALPLAESRLQKAFRPLYFAFVTISCIGGLILATWMRDTLTAGIGEVGDADPYSVIAVMLFVVSIVIVMFSVTVILVVSFEQKNAESEALKEAKTVAERSNAAKSDFLANMSHEIRTPINAVLGMNEMILREALHARDQLPTERKEIKSIFSDICNYSGNIDSAGKNLLSIINDILDFSKIEAGKMELVDSAYKLSAVLNDVSNMISFKAKAKELLFTVEADRQLPEDLYGDEIRVRQIIVNLLNNAVKYTNSGKVSLTVSVKEQRMENEEKLADLVFVIRDTGIGIKKADLARLFGKFQRMDLEKNSTVEGTGLGLAITKSLLEMMNGSIHVESTYGAGSTFTATIPQKVLSTECIGDFRKKIEEDHNAMTLPDELLYAPGAQILVVDDTHLNLIVIKGLLKIPVLLWTPRKAAGKR